MLVLESGVIQALVSNNVFTATFPFLNVNRPGTPGCCGTPSGGIDVNNFKAAVASLGEADRKKFKEVVGADRVKASYHQGGKIYTVIF